MPTLASKRLVDSPNFSHDYLGGRVFSFAKLVISDNNEENRDDQDWKTILHDQFSFDVAKSSRNKSWI